MEDIRILAASLINAFRGDYVHLRQSPAGQRSVIAAWRFCDISLSEHAYLHNEDKFTERLI